MFSFLKLLDQLHNRSQKFLLNIHTHLKQQAKTIEIIAGGLLYSCNWYNKFGGALLEQGITKTMN